MGLLSMGSMSDFMGLFRPKPKPVTLVERLGGIAQKAYAVATRSSRKAVVKDERKQTPFSKVLQQLKQTKQHFKHTLKEVLTDPDPKAKAKQVSTTLPNKPNVSEAPKRTPNYGQSITLQKKEAGLLEGIGLEEWCVGPAVDSAASIPVFCEKDRKRCTKVWKLKTPVKLSGMQGSGEVTEGAWMKVGKHYVQGLLSSDAPESIIPVRDLVNPGGCMMFTGSSCVLIDKDGDTTHMIPGKHGFFYMPISQVQHVQDLEVHEARVKCERELQEHARRMHMAHVKRCLFPKCTLCHPCLMGKMRKGDGYKGPSAPRQDLEVGFDLIGPMVESNDGNIYKLVGCEAHTGYGSSGRNDGSRR